MFKIADLMSEYLFRHGIKALNIKHIESLSSYSDKELEDMFEEMKKKN